MAIRTFVAIALATAGITAAVAAKPADTISTRQKNFKAIGGATKAIGDEVKKPAPSIALIQTSVVTLNGLAPKLPSWFPKGSGPEAGVKTGASPDIWVKTAEFKKAAGDFADAARTLDVAAKSGNLDAIRAGMQTLGGTCKSCHQSFRVKD